VDENQHMVVRRSGGRLLQITGRVEYATPVVRELPTVLIHLLSLRVEHPSDKSGALAIQRAEVTQSQDEAGVMGRAFDGVIQEPRQWGQAQALCFIAK
jgi:hypothetical protein